jgi:hypothetical protein
MKALTLTQPWASLVAFKAKRIETRSWSTNYRCFLENIQPLHDPVPAKGSLWLWEWKGL